MTERVMNVTAVQSYLVNVLHTNKVKVREVNQVITIESAEEIVAANGKKYSCPFLGTAKGGSLTVDKFLEMKQEEKELELENEKR
ncbi:MAG: hypothetical protein LBU58_07885, partial [Clostridiales bacterium]|nr:hypothetical protein [Clostridiales bacterium]